jgi:cyclic beta-1,2-glucan synthetase
MNPLLVSNPSVFEETDDPIRAELFSVERLEQHAESLAASDAVAEKTARPRFLTPRVAENGRLLLESYRTLAKAVKQETAITPAAEWLIDNFFIVEEQLREIRDDLPTGFYRKLPKLSNGPFIGYPRVFGVAWAFVAHTDSRLDLEVLRRFVKAYQRLQPLTIGELWALPITLRVVLIENLRRLVERIVRGRAARADADELADKLLASKTESDASAESILGQSGEAPLATAFAVELLQRLRDLHPNVRPILHWLDERLKAQNTTADEIVRVEHQQQAAMNVTVRNIIDSMRLLSAVDWASFFEGVSIVDEVFAAETNFARMDFATRDSYRHAIEDLSRGSRYSEVEIAQRVVQRVRQARSETSHGNGFPDRKTDPGYYLISRGRIEFERELAFRVSQRRQFLRWYVKSAVPGYLGTIFVLTALILAFPLIHDHEAGVGLKALLLLGLVAVIPASELAIALVNRGVTDLLEPRTLPRMELLDGVPENLRTVVAVPTLLTNKREIDQLVGTLEIHYLANPDGILHFALLSDWKDALSESVPGDDELLAEAADGIARLNHVYGPTPDGGVRFLLFHRRRKWNELEGKWMGWERKRGKLHELNQLLRGSTETTFMPFGGRPVEAPSGVRFVLTLDADTKLPRGAAYELIGTMAHPLNRPEFSPEAGRVVEGYGVVQPRVMPTLPTGHEASLFQKIFSGPSGIDSYAAAVSDVYQDLFREGSYTGKGIYDIDAFEAALAGKVPENAMLSHDLFEGIFARTGLATDIELFDEFPVHVEASAQRQHRWARGDWQLLPWVFGRGPRASQSPEHHRISIPAIGRWKMLDNLRRSLFAPAALLTLLGGWLLTPASGWVWTRFIIAILAIPPLLPVLIELNPRSSGISKRSYFRALASDLTSSATQIGLTITFLAYQAWLMSDAIVRTLLRLFITHKYLLEWTTAAQAKYAVDTKLPAMYRRMIGGVLLAVAAFVAVLFGKHHSLSAAAPFIILWAAAPAVARWISVAPKESRAEPLSTADQRTLRLISRRTWRFFETFVTPTDHALPPDNFQQDPKPVIAHRTSPTNIGLYLLSVLSAHDFGWLGAPEAVGRLEETISTMGHLESFRGHLYNWYATNDLHPLEPKYVSTVDSGNLAGHLLAMANGCRELNTKFLSGSRMLSGLDDSIQLLREALKRLGSTRRTHIVTRKQLANAIEALESLFEPVPTDPLRLSARLVQLLERTQTVADIAQTFALERGDLPGSELLVWAEAARTCMESHFRAAKLLIPWLSLDAKEVLAISERSPKYALEWTAIEPLFGDVPTLSDAPVRLDTALHQLQDLRVRLREESMSNLDTLAHIDALIRAFRQSAGEARSLVERISALAKTAEKMFYAMDFTFLFNKNRKLLSIGYRVAEGVIDPSYYDMLASEARLASFIAIAKGDIPVANWFRLGRSLTPVDRGSALVSWSGSMFEYLMPSLVMRAPAGSLLRQTAQLVVRRQIEYGAERHVPWGVSESAYNARDSDLTYQYTGFGVPGLGLKRGLSEEIVIAPYATGLAAMYDPAAATKNFERIEDAGGRGSYGFYEALDYTPARVPEGKDVAIVFAYLAHHQGMLLVSLANVLHEDAMCKRFHAEPIVQATELLLQERTPRDVLVARPRAEEVSAAAHVRELVPPVQRRFTTPHDVIPRTQLLSNGNYAVMLTAAGSGYSRCGENAVTRWREDVTLDCWGSYIYLRDMQSSAVWSAGYQPMGVEADSYEATFYEDRAEIIRRDRSLQTTLEVVVSSEDDAEMRRVSITNQGIRTREIQITSYAEVCLTPQAADAAHPAFAKLFVETEFVSDLGALVATRRKQSDSDKPVWAAHVVVTDAETIGELEFETGRTQFIGRGHTLREPASIVDGTPLSGAVGSVLDPIFSLRRTVRIPPGKTARVVFSTIVAASRENVINLADKYRDASTFERILMLAWTQAQIQLHHIGIDADEAHLFQRLANTVLYADAALRPPSEILSRTVLELGPLWAQGISGDLPIVLALIDEDEDIGIIRQLLRAHEYWRMKQLPVDLVIVNDTPTSYVQELQNSLANLVRGNQLRIPSEPNDGRGSIFLLRGDQMPVPVRTMLQSVARAVIVTQHGTLAEQVTRAQRNDPVPPRAARSRFSDEIRNPAAVPRDLAFFNGLGGFANNGREYVTILSEGTRTPQPWINVIANPSFGFLASESGAGYTWSINSHENQLTPWSNDPVSDPPGEAIYIRDESTGEFWSPTASPIRLENETYVARHGQGYSRFELTTQGIVHDLLQFVPAKDSIKISRLTLRNDSGRTRRLSVTSYAEWVLGNLRAPAAPYLVTELDQSTGAIFAHSAWTGEFAGRIAFAALSNRQATVTTGTTGSLTGDRKEFLGRNGSLAAPAAIENGEPLSGSVGAALDPCAALQTFIELRPGARVEITFFLGQAENRVRARELLTRYRSIDLDAALREVTTQWNNLLETVEFSTPDPAMDLLLNRWLLYQTLSCRVRARTAFYQASGAYGFRDQLQDIMALVVSGRDLARGHILLAASRQFVEGDVQHWWHPPGGRGIRTRMSDDLLWLPYALGYFLEITGDNKILDEQVPFLEGDLLAEGQNESYFEPRVSTQSATLFEHCARALDRSLNVGVHGLPLMGTGDWNDGMNRVGVLGKGESVWLGWFLHVILTNFARIADARGEHKRAENWRLHVTALKASLEREGWDGEWYRRAYFDDGAPLGSVTNMECQIDSIAQSWAVISGAAEPGRAVRAMQAVDQKLVDRRGGLILLLTPPFDHMPHDPGYIKGYVPGIRENGGQYTHAAVWTVIAFAALGDGDKASELFRMLNPVYRTATRSGVQRYKVEPYVLAGDVYAENPHVGRGGWTWYTGSSGWLYRCGMESILGFRMHGMTFSIDPCIPRSWNGYSITFRYHSAVYKIRVENPANVMRGVALTKIDGKLLEGSANVPLTDDGAEHNVLIVLG